MSEFILLQGAEWQALYENNKRVAQNTEVYFETLLVDWVVKGREILFESFELFYVADYGYGLGHDPITYPESLDLKEWVKGP